MLTFLTLINIVFAAPELNINWLDKPKTQLSFSIKGKDSELESCLNNGLEMQYRYEAKLCKSRKLWYPKCPREFVETHLLSYDPVSDSYSLKVDRHRDDIEPQVIVFNSRRKALQSFYNIENVSLDFLAGGRASLLKSNKRYLEARAFSSCKGEYSKTFSELSYYLTFGLVRIAGFNTGWNRYIINKTGIHKQQEG